jgi:hypothetical protein
LPEALTLWSILKVLASCLKDGLLLSLDGFYLLELALLFIIKPSEMLKVTISTKSVLLLLRRTSPAFPDLIIISRVSLSSSDNFVAASMIRFGIIFERFTTSNSRRHLIRYHLGIVILISH